MILPGSTLGILGGGQLGQMTAMEARRLGYRVAVLDPDPACPARSWAEAYVQGGLDDPAAALALAGGSDVVTLETEHVPAGVLAEVAKARPLHPGAEVLATVQDRARQKAFLDAHGIPTAPWRPVASAAEAAQAAEALGGRVVLKARRGGYDGRGQARLGSPSEAGAAWRALGGAPAIAEAHVPFTAELSALVARGARGEVAAFPVAENVHRAGVLHTTVAPARVPAEVAAAAVAIAERVAAALGHRGMLAVELFLLPGGRLLVNELAPRPHNSGHTTLGACATSQFEQHARAVCGLPLGDPRQLTPAAMLNLLGDLWQGRPLPDLRPVLAEPRARLHLYGKREARPGRKMGHVLVLHPDPGEALALAEGLHAALLRANPPAAQRAPQAGGAP